MRSRVGRGWEAEGFYVALTALGRYGTLTQASARGLASPGLVYHDPSGLISGGPYRVVPRSTA